MKRPSDKTTAPGEPSWQRQLRDAVREIEELERLLEFPPGTLKQEAGAESKFPMLVPRVFVARMKKGDRFDPLLRQVLPTTQETADVDGFGPDPLSESNLARHGSIGKYPGRMLLIATGACPIHCRYCFRREFPYSRETAARDDWQPAIEAVRHASTVREVILSGGDPLSLGNDRLGRLISRLQAIPRIKTLRIHTRFPIALPARVDDGLTGLLRATRLNTVVVVHANHPRELDESVANALQTLKSAADHVLNQSVLLRGINDSVETLVELSERLLQCGVLPYYLHLLDRVSGSAHFEVAEDEGARLIAAMRRQVPGYLVPRLVRDEIGELSKTHLG